MKKNNNKDKVCLQGEMHERPDGFYSTIAMGPWKERKKALIITQTLHRIIKANLAESGAFPISGKKGKP